MKRETPSESINPPKKRNNIKIDLSGHAEKKLLRNKTTFPFSIFESRLYKSKARHPVTNYEVAKLACNSRRSEKD